MRGFRLFVALITVVAVPSASLADKMDRMRRDRDPGPVIQRGGEVPKGSPRKRHRQRRTDAALQSYAGRRAACIAQVNELIPRRKMSGFAEKEGRRVSGLIQGCMQNGGRVPGA
jgi:hypothetical protein